MVERRDIDFEVEGGDHLRGWLFQPEVDAGPHPAISMAHVIDLEAAAERGIERRRDGLHAGTDRLTNLAHAMCQHLVGHHHIWPDRLHSAVRSAAHAISSVYPSNRNVSGPRSDE
jgi:hypothetical protein